MLRGLILVRTLIDATITFSNQKKDCTVFPIFQLYIFKFKNLFDSYLRFFINILSCWPRTYYKRISPGHLYRTAYARPFSSEISFFACNSFPCLFYIPSFKYCIGSCLSGNIYIALAYHLRRCSPAHLSGLFCNQFFSSPSNQNP